MASKVMVTIFSLLAELERDLISERTKMGLARAKAAVKKLGRPKGPGKSKLDGKEAEIKEFLEKGVTRANIAKILDVSWETKNGWISCSGFFVGFCSDRGIMLFYIKKTIQDDLRSSFI